MIKVDLWIKSFTQPLIRLIFNNFRSNLYPDKVLDIKKKLRCKKMQHILSSRVFYCLCLCLEGYCLCLCLYLEGYCLCLCLCLEGYCLCLCLCLGGLLSLSLS